MPRPTPHLTTEMKLAAARYARRLERRNVPAEVALEEAEKLARLNLLTMAGYLKKPPAKKKAPPRKKAPRGRAP